MRRGVAHKYMLPTPLYIHSAVTNLCMLEISEFRNKEKKRDVPEVMKGYADICILCASERTASPLLEAHIIGIFHGSLQLW